MLKSYLHIAARHLTRHRLYALTNVGGLAVGLAGCMLMAIWVFGQLETDRFHEHGERIHRVVTWGEKAARLTTPAILGTSLRSEATEVEAVVRMLNVDNPVPLVSHGERRFYESAFRFADPEILKVFTLPLVAGLLACPIAYSGMAAWMEQFSERAAVGAAPFVVAVAAWVSVAYHAVRTSRIDPVEALRCELDVPPKGAVKPAFAGMTSYRQKRPG